MVVFGIGRGCDTAFLLVVVCVSVSAAGAAGGGVCCWVYHLLI